MRRKISVKDLESETQVIQWKRATTKPMGKGQKLEIHHDGKCIDPGRKRMREEETAGAGIRRLGPKVTGSKLH